MPFTAAQSTMHWTHVGPLVGPQVPVLGSAQLGPMGEIQATRLSLARRPLTWARLQGRAPYSFLQHTLCVSLYLGTLYHRGLCQEQIVVTTANCPRQHNSKDYEGLQIPP